MTNLIEAMGRIEQIQSTLLQLATVTPATTDASAAFAQSLAAALGANALGTNGLGEPGTGTVGATTGGTIANPGAATGADVVADASKYLGVPYVFGGEDATGMDCSGLVQRVYADLGIDVPRLVSGQMKIGTEVGSLAEAKPGDLIVTGGGEHILIYAGNNKVIHAPYEGRTVSLVDAYMKDGDIDTIRRVIPDGASTASSALSAFGAGGNNNLLAAALAALARGGAK